MGTITVYKRRTNVMQISLGYDVSADTFDSEIREGKDTTTTLIATWDISFLTDGTDGILVLTLDNSVTELIAQSSGWMDLKRTSGGEPLPVFDKPVKVVFEEVVTE